MKNIIILSILFFIFFIPNSLAQSGWFWQNPLPQGNDLIDINVLNQNEAIAVGITGTIIKSTDGGLNWDPKISGTIEHLMSVEFINDNIGWAVGYTGTILKSIDSGNAWTNQMSGTTEDLTSVHFSNIDSGCAVGRTVAPRH